MAWTAALPFCLSPNTRSIHWQSICETWSDSRACLWMRMKSRGSFLAHGGRFTWFTRSLFCRTPKSKPARGESGKYHANIRRGKMCSNNSILMFYMNIHCLHFEDLGYLKVISVFLALRHTSISSFHLIKTIFTSNTRRSLKVFTTTRQDKISV